VLIEEFFKGNKRQRIKIRNSQRQKNRKFNFTLTVPNKTVTEQAETHMSWQCVVSLEGGNSFSKIVVQSTNL